MNENEIQIKLSYVPGLRDIVFEEINKTKEIKILREEKNSFYIVFMDDMSPIKNLRSVSKAYLVEQNKKYNPIYLVGHKSVLGNLIEEVRLQNPVNSFKTFRIYCAGAKSSKISALNKYIEDSFKLSKSEEADLKAYIIKVQDTWEVGVQITPRPLSLRDYKIKNMHGGMNPTIAYALNHLCDLGNCNSYLNIFSGSATLMIEAAMMQPHIEHIIGFDNNKENLSLSIQNIKSAGLIKKIQIKEADILDNPEFGTFDVIVSDLPFGMAISKDQDMTRLYEAFLEYSSAHLSEGGKLGVYTSEFELFESLIPKSDFKIEKEVKISLITSEKQYLPVKIFVLKLKEESLLS